jgi:hypothetical protein
MRERARMRACVRARVCGCGAFEIRSISSSGLPCWCQRKDVAAEHRPDKTP